MIRVIRDLLRYDGRFRVAFVFLLAILVMSILSAVSPDRAQRYWLIDYLEQARAANLSPEAPWDGLTLLGLHVLVHG